MRQLASVNRSPGISHCAREGNCEKRIIRTTNSNGASRVGEMDRGPCARAPL